MLSAFKNLQILGHMMLVRMTIGGDAQIFFSYLLQMVCLDFVDMDDIFDSVLQLTPKQPLAPNFNHLDYDSTYSIRNFGSLFMMFLIVPLSLLIAYPLKYIKHSKAAKIHVSLMNSLHWSGTINFLNESLLLFALCGMINTMALTWDNYGAAINSICAIIFLGISLYMMIFWASFYRINENNLTGYKEKFRLKYANIYSELNVLRHKEQAFNYMFLVASRKIVMSASLVYLQR